MKREEKTDLMFEEICCCMMNRLKISDSYQKELYMNKKNKDRTVKRTILFGL